MTASVKWMLLLPGVPIPNSCTTSLTGIKRGCGLTPFTVESLSTYRVLASDGPATSFLGDALDTHDCTHMILENLKVSGAQNTIRTSVSSSTAWNPLQSPGSMPLGNPTKRMVLPAGLSSQWVPWERSALNKSRKQLKELVLISLSSAVYPQSSRQRRAQTLWRPHRPAQPHGPRSRHR